MEQSHFHSSRVSFLSLVVVDPGIVFFLLCDSVYRPDFHLPETHEGSGTPAEFQIKRERALFPFCGFQSKYPFYFPADPENNMAYFFAWHFLYLIQFAALEFFFRGFMVHNLKAGFGTGSVFIMTIPYCMIHFGKPGAETLAAIPAGIILGLLSLKGNSVVPGIFLHYLVALAMDVFSLWQKGII
jgi:membrane protease YdiL (CAAX protease family)